MSGGMFIFAAVDAQAKILTETLHPVQIVWVRQMGLLMSVVALTAFRGIGIFKSQALSLQMFRGFVAVCSALLFIMAIAYVPLTDAIAVSFVAPFMVTLLGIWFLGEKVGLRRWLALIVGFIGAMVIIRPGLGVMHPAIFLIILASFFFATRQVLSRKIAPLDNSYTTIAYTGLVGTLVISIPLPYFWVWPESGFLWLLIFSVAILAAVGEFLVIRALESAETVIVAPLQYTLIIWGTFYGFVIFGHVPDFWTWIGAAVIVASGLYVLHREHIKGGANQETKKRL